jgi:hypothetical protein
MTYKIIYVFFFQKKKLIEKKKKKDWKEATVKWAKPIIRASF